MDSCLPAMEIVRRRNASGGRLGLSCCAADPGDVQEPQLSSHEAGLRFDLVVRGGGRSPHYDLVERTGGRSPICVLISVMMRAAALRPGGQGHAGHHALRTGGLVKSGEDAQVAALAHAYASDTAARLQLPAQ